MFRNSELKRLLKARTTALKIAEEKVAELNEENKAVFVENKELRGENEDLKDCLRAIEKETEMNQYGNIRNYTNKIKSILETAKSI